MPHGNLMSFICNKKYCVYKAFSWILWFCWLHRMWILFLKRPGEMLHFSFCMLMDISIRIQIKKCWYSISIQMHIFYAGQNWNFQISWNRKMPPPQKTYENFFVLFWSLPSSSCELQLLSSVHAYFCGMYYIFGWFFYKAPAIQVVLLCRNTV